MHESYDREDRTKMGSERAFGLVFVVVFTVIAAGKFFAGNVSLFWPAFWASLAAIMLGLAVFRPLLLRPLNRIWFKFGMILHKIVNPIVMGLVFFLTITPIGLVMRILGRRPLDLEFDPKADSYWIDRTPPGPPPGSFDNQY
ncbi:hypothetical protein KAJ83_14030 [Marivibrio halodurans]|uniref:SxtJ n=1 Tax=Marivibrio halodurans TaxID=2039722 RepID=A0A8J7S3P8_9PROT|nr:SxtJ family membrane protein [Marivibrio halodurans]MBP5858134.1 hypothetical protein [Marivibrio halodurans]